MNLSKLFEMQKVLDERIIREKGLEGQDLLPNTILALQVELGELANEWRGFKHWSNDQEPRTHAYKTVKLPVSHGPTTTIVNPMLEEYVDCLHFIMSIGLQRKYGLHVTEPQPATCDSIVRQFNFLFDKVGDFFSVPSIHNYDRIWELFLGLGEMLGFTRDEIEQAYIDKNRVNHERQASGY